mmetsp:Transcript_17999/g.37201  ORF Transcript_17999/g.37201 Transcript_17999/m.37201 type:complete len:547 (-) Transcript_17999:134-1774(-)|eukprot:CAMPEP_0172454862 /NCGR_PEP_ID=MMETSP1065-20121228/11726_1 /TAXON_ID=265537 /ORGANISM="Amphiprora paludosa, Strain CCMP125" /LENGTH=546 /DNA_ID=CAMNT_0013207267 /DNA_START=108 /DNA_END=1748 /DNA_ORIENTATION=+
MSTEESKPEEAVKAPAETSDAKEESNGADSKPRNNKKGPRKREERKPVEELFDLSKPIPKADKPNKAQFDEDLEALSASVKELQDKRKAVQDKIDSAMDDPNSRSKLAELRSEMKGFKEKKGALIKEKQAIRAELNSVKNANDKALKEKKDAKSSVKFGSVDDINKEIRALERKQETTSMTLTEEKKLIKEIDALKASKKLVVDIKSKDATMDDLKVQRKSLGDQIKDKDKEIDALSADIEKTIAAMEEINKNEQGKKDTIKELFNERDAIKKQITEKIAEKDALRDEFHESNNKWYDYQRAIKAQKKIQYEEEKAQRDAERAEYEAKLKAEEEKKIPYEAEQELCEFLASYLERTYLGGKEEEKKENGEAEDAGKVKDDPFAGFKPLNKKKDDGEDEYFGKGKGKKKRVRASKKQDTAARPFTLSVDMFEQFSMISMEPPTNVSQVEKAVTDLRAKKQWFKEQPRGSVPTAQDIRKKMNSEKKKTPNNKSNKPSNGGATADDFLPTLGSGSSTTVNTSWGQKPAANPSAAVDVTPAEAAAAEGAL